MIDDEHLATLKPHQRARLATIIAGLPRGSDLAEIEWEPIVDALHKEDAERDEANAKFWAWFETLNIPQMEAVLALMRRKEAVFGEGHGVITVEEQAAILAIPDNEDED